MAARGEDRRRGGLRLDGEGLLGGFRARGVDPAALRLRALRQGGEVESRQPFAMGGLEAFPERELARDAQVEALELDQPAQRGIAPELAVQLHSAELLAGPSRGTLHRVLPYPQ